MLQDPQAADNFDILSRKMLKLIIISEQWPWALSWILQVISTMESERRIYTQGKDETESIDSQYFLSKELGFDVSNDDG